MKIVVSLALGLMLVSCAFFTTAVGRLKSSVTECAQQNLDELKTVGWQQVADFAFTEIDNALRGAWSDAEVLLSSYVEKYGLGFVNCVVTTFRAYYADVIASADAGTSPAPKSVEAKKNLTGPALGQANADAWLSSH